MKPTAVRRLNQFWFYAAIVGSLGLLCIGWWAGSSHGLTVPGARLVMLSRLFGLLAAYCILLEVLMMARVPFFEENFELEELVDLHRLNGYGILLGIVAHTVFVTLGYAAPGHTALWTQFIHLNTQYEDILWATIGTLVLFAATAVSVRAMRQRMRYEVWFLSHLTLYGAILLASLHIFKDGGDFVGHFWYVAYWYTLYILVFGLLAYYRFMRQMETHMRHRFAVLAVRQEAEGIYSVYVTGRNIDEYVFKAGQYATWRILTPSLWWEAHPFSFSGAPGRELLRFTVKASGDFSSKLANLAPGAPVIIDGPRGSFTADRADDSTNVVLIAGGIGVAPYLSTIHELLDQGKNVTLLYAARTHKDIAFRDELVKLKRQGLTVEAYLSDTNGRINADVLSRFANRDTTVFLCGPDVMSRELSQELLESGFPKKAIITERFAF